MTNHCRISNSHSPPSTTQPHLSHHAWPTTTLLELSHALTTHLATTPASTTTTHPQINTRLQYRHIFPSPPSPHTAATYRTRSLGSIILGQTNKATDTLTLADAKFVLGDWISVAVLESGEDGEVVEALDEAVPALEDGRGERRGRDRFGIRGRGSERQDGWANGGRSRWGGRGPFGGGRSGEVRDFPTGDWKRGEVVFVGEGEGERIRDGGGGGGNWGRGGRGDGARYSRGRMEW